MSWILILVIFGGGPRTPSIDHIEFSTRNACETAATAVHRGLDDHVTRALFTVCVPKDTPSHDR